MPDEPTPQAAPRPQAILEAVLQRTQNALAIKLAEQGDADRTRRLPDLLIRWKDVMEGRQYPTLYPVPDGGMWFNADEDLRLENKIHQDQHGKPLTDAESVERIEKYVGQCAHFLSLMTDAAACRDAAIRRGTRLNLCNECSALRDFQPDCLTRDAATLSAALQAARKIIVAGDAMGPAPAATAITREDASRQLSDIRTRVLAMRGEQLTDPGKMHRRLRVHQSEAMKVYRSAVQAGLLTSIINQIPGDLFDESLPWHWRKLAEAIHAKQTDRIPSVVVLERVDSMSEWLNHGEQLIAVLIDLLNRAGTAPKQRVMLSPGQQAMAMGLTSRNDDEHRANLKFVRGRRTMLIERGARIYWENRGNLGTYVSDQDWQPFAIAFKQDNKGDRDAAAASAADKVMAQQPAQSTDGGQYYICNSCGETFLSNKPQCTRAGCRSNNVELHRPAAAKRKR